MAKRVQNEFGFEHRAGTASLFYRPSSSLVMFHSAVILPLVKNPRSGGTASLFYRPSSSLVMFHSAVILPLVKNPRSGGTASLIYRPTSSPTVMPAKAGISSYTDKIPAFAGMTNKWGTKSLTFIG